MRITRDEVRALGRRKRDEVVVVPVARANRRDFVGIVDEHTKVPYGLHEPCRKLFADPLCDLRILQGSFELLENLRREDELELAVAAPFEDPRRRASRRKGGGQQDVDVEDRAQPLFGRRDLCCASTARASASSSGRSIDAHISSRTSRPSPRRSASSITSLSRRPVRAARTRIARKTCSSSVTVVRCLAIAAS